MTTSNLQDLTVLSIFFNVPAQPSSGVRFLVCLSGPSLAFMLNVSTLGIHWEDMAYILAQLSFDLWHEQKVTNTKF